VLPTRSCASLVLDLELNSLLNDYELGKEECWKRTQTILPLFAAVSLLAFVAINHFRVYFNSYQLKPSK